MNIQQTVPNIRDAFRNWRRQRWLAQLVDLNTQIAQLECVRSESRPVRTMPSQADRYRMVVKSLAMLYGRRRTLAKRLRRYTS